jgi:hypothetical protein
MRVEPPSGRKTRPLFDSRSRAPKLTSVCRNVLAEIQF